MGGLKPFSGLRTKTESPWGRSTLTELLAVAEPWEDRPELTDAAVIRVTVLSSGACLASGLLLWLIGGLVLRHATGFAGFFWIHPMGRWFVSTAASLHGIWPLVTIAGAAGLVLTAVIASRPTRARTRWAVLPLLAASAVGCGSDLFLACLLAVQVVLWILAFAAGIALVVGIIAALASS